MPLLRLGDLFCDLVRDISVGATRNRSPWLASERLDGYRT